MYIVTYIIYYYVCDAIEYVKGASALDLTAGMRLRFKLTEISAYIVFVNLRGIILLYYIMLYYRYDISGCQVYSLNL